MGAIQETTGDFDGDGDITGKDLDIMWAYIQTKALAQAEWDDNLLKEDGDETKCIDMASRCSPVDPETGVITPVKECNNTNWNLNLSHPGSPNLGHDCPPCCNYLPTNFITKMLDLYEANQDAGLAEDVAGTSNTLGSIPGTYELGKQSKPKQFKILQYWKLNEVPQAKDTSGSAHMADDEVIESVYGKIESNATIGNVTRVTANNTQNLIEFDDSDAKLKLNDKSLVSTKDWTLIIKGKTRDLGSTGGFFKVFNKGLFSLGFFGDKNLVTVTDSNAENINDGNQNNTNAIYYRWPDQNPWNKDVTIYLVKKGFVLKLIVDNGSAVEEYPVNLAAHHSNIGVSEKTEKLPLIIHGETFSSLKYVQVIDDSLTAEQVKGFSVNHEIDEYIYKHSLSVSDMGSLKIGTKDASLDSYIGFTTQITDDFNNPLKLHNVNYKETNGLKTPTGLIKPCYAGQHILIFRDNITGGTSNGFSYSNRDTVLALGHIKWTKTHMAMLDGLSMKSNFTVSFWFRAKLNSDNTFLRFQSSRRDIRDIDDNNRTDRVDIILTDAGKKINAQQVISDVVTNKNFFVNGTDLGFDANWQHLTFVKNGDLLGLWMNKTFKGFVSFTNQQQDDLDRVVMSLSGNGQPWATSNNNNRFADLRVLGYAMSNVPSNNLVTHDYSFIDKLKS
tara:strand:- start:546 stop:2558 length:2013 start_codon:yes stop_codon:yes gene_type:complete